MGIHAEQLNLGNGFDATSVNNLLLNLETAGAGAGGLAFNGTAVRVDAGLGMTLTANGVQILPNTTDGGGIPGIEVAANGVRIAAAAVGTGLSGGGGSAFGIDTAGTITFSGANWTFGNTELKVSGSTFTGTQVPNADWVSTQVATGVAWKYPVLATEQLDSTNDAIRQAMVFYLDNNAVATDTFLISDGTTTETWTAVAGAAAANQFSIDTSVDACMTSLATRISADSTLWDAVLVTGLNSINDGSGTSTAGTVIVIYRTLQSATSYDDRIYSNGVNNTQADWRIVSFAGENTYTKNIDGQLSTADPATKLFGTATITASLVAGEAHVVLNDDSQYVWNADGGVWSLISGTGSATAGAGLTKSGNTININSGTGTANGITVNADNIQVALEAAGTGTGGLALVGNEIRVLAGSGIALSATGVGVDTGDGLGLFGGRAVAQVATAVGAQQYGGLVRTRNATGAGAGSANAGYLAVATDNSSLEITNSNFVAIKAGGVVSSMLANNAATVTKLGIRMVEDSLDDTGWSLVSGSVYEKALTEQPIVDRRLLYANQLFVNGVADRTNNGGVDPVTGTYRFHDTGVAGRIRVFGNPASSGNTFLCRYWTVNP